MVEELLSVPGFSPELLYGRYEPRPDGRAGLRRKSGLLGLLRTSGPAAVDANAAPREVLLAAGLESSLADRLIEERSERPLRPGSPLLELAARQAARVALAASEDATAWALTATAQLEDDRAVRAVAATAAYDVDRGGFHIRRWHERAH